MRLSRHVVHGLTVTDTLIGGGIAGGKVDDPRCLLQRGDPLRRPRGERDATALCGAAGGRDAVVRSDGRGAVEPGFAKVDPAARNPRLTDRHFVARYRELPRGAAAER